MRKVFPPIGAADRPSECVEAMEAAILQLVDRAEQAGWTRDEAMRAICVVVWRNIAFEDGAEAA